MPLHAAAGLPALKEPSERPCATPATVSPADPSSSPTAATGSLPGLPPLLGPGGRGHHCRRRTGPRTPGRQAGRRDPRRRRAPTQVLGDRQAARGRTHPSHGSSLMCSPRPTRRAASTPELTAIGQWASSTASGSSPTRSPAPALRVAQARPTSSSSCPNWRVGRHPQRRGQTYTR